MNQGLVFNAKAIAGLIQQVNKLLRMDIDQIQTLMDGKPQRRSALACVSYSGVPETPMLGTEDV
jgi:hypothetical protein